MSIRGRWQVVETPGYDMALASAYILFDEAGGEFALDCLTGSIHGACHRDTVEFGWHEIEPAEGDGWAELKDDSSLEGKICLLNDDNIPFIARRSKNSSTACSHVRCQECGRALSFRRRGRRRSAWCLQQEAGPKTTVEQALMRGLDTA